MQVDELQRWRRDLFAPAKPRLYYSDKHTDARTGVIREAGVFSYEGSSPGLAAKLADFVRRRCRPNCRSNGDGRLHRANRRRTTQDWKQASWRCR